MSHGVDAAVQPVQLPPAQPSVDRVFPYALVEQLASGNDPVLAFCQVGNQLIRPARLLFPAYRTGNCNLGGHPPSLILAAAQMARTARHLCG